MQTEKTLLAMMRNLDSVEQAYYSELDFDLTASTKLAEKFNSYCEAKGLIIKNFCFLEDGAFFAQAYIIPTIACLGPHECYRVVFSSFGNMIAIEGDANNFNVNAIVEESAIFAGLTFVPNSVLQIKYDGCQSGVTTWWERFFDYL